MINVRTITGDIEQKIKLYDPDNDIFRMWRYRDCIAIIHRKNKVEWNRFNLCFIASDQIPEIFIKENLYKISCIPKTVNIGKNFLPMLSCSLNVTITQTDDDSDMSSCEFPIQAFIDRLWNLYEDGYND